MKQHSQVGTMLEPVSRKLVLVRTPDKQATTVRKAFARALGSVPCAMCNAHCARP